ncbi:uncharacterized protein LOC114410891 [Glycine soja]|uniref:uncharacterized protein LOC114410891 n=1 Tax=Glycine soja TaxID=3848 RepID=UPI0010390DEC|nr:uncharacterized protein LOC114410891 [Glycine soja]
MRALLRNHLLHLSRSPARTLLVRLQACELSSSSSSPPHTSREVSVSVWWDLMSCPVPNDVNPLKAAPAITQAVRANGIKGPIDINAFGDFNFLSERLLDALGSSDIPVTHFPRGSFLPFLLFSPSHFKAFDRSFAIGRKSYINVDIMFWAFNNPPPAHFFLISSDIGFAGLLHRLNLNNYCILLAGSRNARVLSMATTITWQWYKLLRGENLIAKHFNHAPDGPYASWYGNFGVPLENPFPAPDSLKMSSKGSSDDDIVGSEDASRKSQERYTTSMNRSAGNDQTAVDDIGTANYESGKPELFSSSSFWNDMESFIFTLRGSLIVSQSKNREDMARKLRKNGPPVFRSLSKKDILQLLELLISEKKWLEESPTQTFPFQLKPVHKDSLEYSERSRYDILDDCDRFVHEILREHPDGFKISSFPRFFVARYGYHLDLQKLGYRKLTTLLQIMTGVKVESNYIYRSY